MCAGKNIQIKTLQTNLINEMKILGTKIKVDKDDIEHIQFVQ